MSNETVTPTYDEEFDRLYQEAGVQGQGQKQGEEVKGAPATAADTTTSTQQASGGQAASGDAGAGGGTSATPPGATGTTGQQQATQQQQQSEEDWTSTLPKDMQDRIAAERTRFETEKKQLEDRYTSLHGRLSPVQQQLADAQRRLAQMERQQTTVTVQTAATDGKQTPSPVESFYGSPVWKKFESEYPGDAEVLRTGFDAQQQASRQQLDQLSAQVQQLTQRLGQTEEVTSRTVVSDETSKLEAVHKDWREIDASKEYWEWFDGWRAQQPKSIRGMYYDPQAMEMLMNDSDFLIARISEFKAHRQPAAATTTAATTTQQTQTDSTQPAQQQQTQQAPQQTQQAPTDVRLRMGVAPEVRGGSPLQSSAPSIEGMTYDEQFDHLYAQYQN